MELTKQGEYKMKRGEIADFNDWLSNNPRERYKNFNEVVETFIEHKEKTEDVNEMEYSMSHA